MRIAFDTSRLEGPRTGIHRIVSSLLETSAAMQPDSTHEWIPIQRPDGIRSLAYLLHHLPKLAREAGADLILSPHAWDFPGTSALPVVSMLLDVWPWTHLDMTDPHAARHKILQPFPRRAAGIIHISDFTRREFHELWPECVVRDTVVPMSPGEHFTKEGSMAAEGIPEGEFFLGIASRDPRKNLPFLLDLVPRLNAPLVVVGDAPMEDVSGALHLGPCHDEMLGILYRRAKAFLYPSLYEGFGMPPTEAAKCGCPVLVSDLTSLPEVMGYDFPGMIPLGNGDRWAETANLLLRDDGARRKFIAAGDRVVARYSWRKTFQGIEEFCGTMLENPES
ncbi:MAG: glycosyltransferase [Candidatus Hydrogenedentota bacterium]|mgnify:CR=1 FL=1